MAKEKNNEGIVEAALFLAGRFMSLQELVMYTGINPITLKEVMRNIETKHNGSPSGALRILNKGELYKMDIKEEHVWLTNKLASGSAEFTKAEQETLAIIAYKQPVTRAEAEKIRGVNVGGVLKTLIEKDLLEVRGRKDVIGKPLLYGTTDKFLQIFGLNSLADLPQLKEFTEEDLEYGKKQEGMVIENEEVRFASLILS